MKKTTLWIIGCALTVHFLGVFAVPSVLEAAETPRVMWTVDWQRVGVAERTIGVLRIVEGKLLFEEQLGQVDWTIDLANVKHVGAANGGRALSIVSMSGEEYVLTVLDPSLMQVSPKKAVESITRAVQSLAATRR